MKLTLNNVRITEQLQRLQDAHPVQAKKIELNTGQRSPVHTVYGGAQLFKRDLCAKFGKVALDSLAKHADTVEAWRDALGLTRAPLPDATRRSALDRGTSKPDDFLRIDSVFYLAWLRMKSKLTREPVEDYRIDFEDGFGHRSSDEEDKVALSSAAELALSMSSGSAPPFVGIRVRALWGNTASRALRTLDLFVTELVAKAKKLPSNFCVALPKVYNPRQAQVLCESLAELEQGLKLPSGAIKIELMLETGELLFGKEGRSYLPETVRACAGRCSSVHFGLFDLTSDLGVAAHAQYLRHPYCDIARFMMATMLNPIGVRVVDSITHIIPIEPKRAGADQTLSPQDLEFNKNAVQRAWRLHFENVRNALKLGFYQGWDLHPAQLPVRYFTTYLFFLEGLADVVSRLQRFIAQAKQSSLSDNTFDDQATVSGLVNFIQGGFSCGAFTVSELEQLGLKLDQVKF